MFKKKKTMGKAHVRALLPMFKEFNSLSKVFISMLNKKIEAKQTAVKQIKVLVSGMSTPGDLQSNISITTVDINKTSIRGKTGGSYNQVMDWESDFMKNRKKFII
ncbi:hypothetical protein HOH45_03665 [bacterium]|jgi:hypothetical protein|nr:hypothetical protein [bacterium]